MIELKIFKFKFKFKLKIKIKIKITIKIKIKTKMVKMSSFHHIDFEIPKEGFLLLT
jgi:hypothetical protein